MTLIPHSRVNPPRALRDAIAVNVRGKPIPRRLLSADAYCIDPRCDCEDVHLRLIELPYHRAEGGTWREPAPLDELMRRVWDAESSPPEVRLEKQGSRRTVTLVDGDDPDGALMEALRGLVTRERIAIFAEHHRETREWGRDNWWRYQDWQGLDLDTCVPWHKVFPASTSFELVHEGTEYLLLDEYCAQPACACAEALISVLRLTDRGRKGVEVGAARISLEPREAGRISVENRFPPRGRATARRVIEAFLESRPKLVETLRERKERMREFGAFVLEEQRKLEPSLVVRASGFLERLRIPCEEPGGPPAAAAAIEPSPQTAVSGRRPGRNEPCPCGSGRKYKRCCGRA